jgi:dTDP-4-dehydrorhamnose 3,5-epimerase
MQARATKLPGLLLLEPKVYSDPRGYFFESWSERRYIEHGVPASFVQDNVSRSTRGTLRGLHLQAPPMEQGKLVSVLDGEVFDVVVDVRSGSPTFGQWLGETLSASNARQLYVPPGFAHGFCVLSESALFAYKCTQYYSPQAELALRWNDPEIGIVWPLAEPLLSAKDAAAPSLRELVLQLKQKG